MSAPDQVFPHFIANHLPPGLSGLVIAAILAAAMSSSLNAIASTVVADLLRVPRSARDDTKAMRASRIITVLAGIAQIAVGVALQSEGRSALNTVLAIAGLINGPILGAFFLGTTKRATSASAFIGMSAGLVAVLLVAFGTRVAWPWYTLVGSATTWSVGMIAAWIFTARPGASSSSPRAET